MIVAKVGLQSRPPPAREGKPFKSFGEVLAYIVEHEGPWALFKGIGPQLLKGLLVQGLLMMTKERVEVLFVMLFAYLRVVRARRLQLTQELRKKVVEQTAPVAGNLQSVAGNLQGRAESLTAPVAGNLQSVAGNLQGRAESLQSRVMPVAENVLEKAKSALPVTTK